MWGRVKWVGGYTGISEESIKNPHTSDTTFSPDFLDLYGFNRVNFKVIYLKQDSIYFLHKKVVNLSVSY